MSKRLRVHSKVNVTGHGGTRTGLKTIEQMEAEAKENFDSTCSKRIRGEWLQVERLLDANYNDRFEYKWGKNVVDRKVAVEVLASA